MNASTLGWALFIAFAYSAWPVIGKWSGVTGAWMGVLVLVGSFIGTTALSLNKIVGAPLPTAKAVLVVLLAGAVNGLAIYVASLKSADSNIQTGTFLATIFIFMVVMAPVIDSVLNGSPFSLRHGLGLVLAAGAVYLFNS